VTSRARAKRGNPATPGSPGSPPGSSPDSPPACSPHAPSRAGFFAQAVAIAAKDLRIEWRSREILYTTVFLAALIVLVFAFAFISGADTNPPPGVIAGILWVSVLFSGTVALGRTFDRERENESIRSLLLSPVPRPAIYLGKLAATFTLMTLVQVVVVPLVGLLFSAEIGRAPLHLAATLLLGTLGFAAAGVVLSAALLRARSRDTLLASLLYPVVVPVFLAGAQSTSQLLDPALPTGGALFWTQFLVAADIVFVVVGLWAFEPVVTGE
jgi:heme exporter protein B